MAIYQTSEIVDAIEGMRDASQERGNKLLSEVADRAVQSCKEYFEPLVVFEDDSKNGAEEEEELYVVDLEAEGETLAEEILHRNTKNLYDVLAAASASELGELDILKALPGEIEAGKDEKFIQSARRLAIRLIRKRFVEAAVRSEYSAKIVEKGRPAGW